MINGGFWFQKRTMVGLGEQLKIDGLWVKNLYQIEKGSWVCGGVELDGEFGQQ